MTRQGDGSREVRVSVLADTGVRKELWGLGEAGWRKAKLLEERLKFRPYSTNYYLVVAITVHTNLRWLGLVILLHDIALSFKEEFLYFSIISEVSILLSRLDSKELLRDLCKISKHIYNDLIE